MDDWGSRLVATVETVAAATARGLGLAPDAFTSRMRLGPHLLAPTGSDLAAHSALGTVLAGYHYGKAFCLFDPGGASLRGCPRHSAAAAAASGPRPMAHPPAHAGAPSPQT